MVKKECIQACIVIHLRNRLRNYKWQKIRGLEVGYEF